MKTNKGWIGVAITLMVLTAGSAFAQRKTVAVATVKIAPSVVTAAKADQSYLSLQRVAEAIDGQTMDALNGTRKFEVIARSDLDALMEEGGLTGAGLTPGEADYLIVPVVDDFQDYVETATFSAMGKTVTKRKIRLGMVARIYHVADGGKLVESTNIQLENKDIEQLMDQSVRSGPYSEELMRKIAEQMASKTVNRVVDVIYPATIIALTGPQATINRGDGTGIAVGQVWEVFATGEEMVDPDTGESLGRSEVKIGSLRIDRVTPKFSTGTLTENFGAEKGAVVRPLSQ